MGRTLMVAAVLACALAACGGGGDDEPEATAASTTTATVAQTPEQAFLDELDAQLTFGDPTTGRQAALDTARNTCTALDNTTPVQAGSNDEVLAAAGTTQVDVLSEVARATADNEAITVVLTLGAEHFCPQHTDVIASFLATLS